MKKAKFIVVLIAFLALVIPVSAQAEWYDDQWQGIITENIYPWGSRLWEPWQRVMPKKPVNIGVSVPAMDIPYFVNQIYGYITEAEATGVGMTILGAKSYGDVEGQISQIENLIQKGADVLIIGTSSSEGLVAISEEAVAKGIPVYFIGESTYTDKLSGYVCENDFDFGFRAVDWLCKKLNGKGKLVFLSGTAGSTYTEAINKGALHALKDYPGVKLVDQRWGPEYDPAIGQATAENMLTAYPDLDGFFVVEAQCHGVANALKEKNLQDKVLMSVAYPFQETIPYIKDGSVDYGVTGYSLTNVRIVVNMVIRNHNQEKKVPRYVWTSGLEMKNETIDQFPRPHVWAPEGWEPPASMVIKPKKK